MPKYIELEKALESLQHKYENMYGCNPSFYAGYPPAGKSRIAVLCNTSIKFQHKRRNDLETVAPQASNGSAFNRLEYSGNLMKGAIQYDTV